MKASKGTLESGQAYDSTKAYVLMDMDTRKGQMRGQSAEEFNIGDSTVFERFEAQAFPFLADVQFELVTTGSNTRTVVHEIKPIKPAPVKA